jgi:hypothetical protein
MRLTILTLLGLLAFAAAWSKEGTHPTSQSTVWAC